MDDFLADVNRRAEGFEGNLDDVDGADYACTEASGLEEEYALGRRCGAVNRLNGKGVNCGRCHIYQYTVSGVAGVGLCRQPRINQVNAAFLKVTRIARCKRRAMRTCDSSNLCIKWLDRFSSKFTR